MYAVIKTGGKQYKVAAGEKIKVEQIAADVGQEIVIDQVLAVGNGADLKVGSPLVAGASVKATVVAQGKHDKVHIFKMRRRKHYRKSQGHRQTSTELQSAFSEKVLRSIRAATSMTETGANAVPSQTTR